jgi:tetratricopeptide (TPR) repeat protein
LDSEFKKGYWFFASLFFAFFLLLTPLGAFNDWISPALQTGVYSISFIDPGDDSGYYAYLRSSFFDGDLDFINERFFSHHETFTSTGYTFNNWQFGQSVLFFPFFLLGHWIACLLKILGYPVTTDGYSFPYFIATALGSQTYLFAGLIITWNLLKKFFKEPIPKLATISIWLGTFLLYYSFIRQRMAHTQEFFFAAVFVSYWLKIRTNHKRSEHVLLGAILGILCCIRVINIGFLALYFIDQWLLANSGIFVANWNKIKTFLQRSFYFIGSFALAFLPQNFIWFKLDGIPLPAFHTDLADSSISSLSLNSIFAATIKFFFSLKWGLFISAPLLFIGIIGILANRKKLKDIQAGLAAGIFAFIFIIIFLFRYLDAYEYRYLSPALPLFAIGLGVLLENLIKNKKVWLGALFFIGIFLLTQYFMIVQYKITIPYNHPEFTFKAISQIPQILSNDISIALRSTSWFRLISLENKTPWNYKDFIYLIFFPLFQVGFLFLIYYFFSKVKSLKEKKSKWLLPNYLSGTIFSFSILLICIIAVITPAKNQEEINQRKQYSKLIKSAKLFIKQGRQEQAVDVLKKAKNLNLNLWTPYFELGLIYQARKKYSESNKHFQEVLKLNPQHPSSLINLGDNFNILGDYENAKKYFENSIKTQSLQVEAFDGLGQVYAKQNRFDDSEKMFKTAITLKPDYAKGHLNLSILYTQIKEEQKAIHHLEETVRLGLTDQTVINLLKLYGLSLMKIDP